MKDLFSKRERRGREFAESLLKERKENKQCLLQTRRIVYIELEIVK